MSNLRECEFVFHPLLSKMLFIHTSRVKLSNLLHYFGGSDGVAETLNAATAQC